MSLIDMQHTTSSWIFFLELLECPEKLWQEKIVDLSCIVFNKEL